MEGKGAVVFLPREDGRFNWMLEELMFAPPAVWMAEALRAEGFEKFLVVCHDDDRQAAQACFPEGTGYVTTPRSKTRWTRGRTSTPFCGRRGRPLASPTGSSWASSR